MLFSDRIPLFSVAMRMVRVRHMWMRMPQRLVTMPWLCAPVGIGTCTWSWWPSSWRCACSCSSLRVHARGRAIRKVQHHPCEHQHAAQAISQLVDWSPIATASAAPMKGANAKTEPVRAAPNALCASR